MSAELGVVGGDSIANLELGNFLAACLSPKSAKLTHCTSFMSAYRTDSCDDADGFVAGDQGELGDEFTLVDVLRDRSADWPIRDSSERGQNVYTRSIGAVSFGV